MPAFSLDHLVTTDPSVFDIRSKAPGPQGALPITAEMLRERGISAATFYPRVLSPLPVARIKEWAEGMDTILVPEVNYTGQFARMVRADCGIEVISQTQITGRPFTAADIADFIEQEVPAATGAAA